MIEHNTYNTKLTQEELEGLYKVNRNKDDMPSYFYLKDSYCEKCIDILNDYIVIQHLLLQPVFLSNESINHIKLELSRTLDRLQNHTDEIDFNNLLSFISLKRIQLIQHCIDNEFYEAYTNLRNIL